VTLNETLIAIGGYMRHYSGGTKKVEVYEGGIWNDQTIQPIGNKDGRLNDFTSLEIKRQLYVFGNISVYYNISRLKFVLKLNYFLLRWMYQFPQNY